MRPLKGNLNLSDDLEMSSLVKAIESTIKQWENRSEAVLSFGPQKVSREEYLRGLQYLLKEAKADSTGQLFRSAIQSHFDAYEVYGGKQWGEVLVTSYYEPVIDGALKSTERFTQAIYQTPKDLVEVDVTSFEKVRPELAKLRELPFEQRSAQNVLRGRLISEGVRQRVVAMPDRREIDRGSVKVQSQPLAYVDPIDAFFLEIQGSGVIRLKNGRELKVGYAAQNGHPYVPIGRFLLERIPKEKMSIQAIEDHLRSLPEAEAKTLMEQNPSYVFFRKLETAGQTFFGTEVIAGRTIATDQSLFPKGSLAFLEFEKPQFASSSDKEPTSWGPSSRFVVDHDTGGAIRGPHRVDLFWGRGGEAKRHAGVMKNPGRLIYFVPRPDWVNQLRASQTSRRFKRSAG